MKPPFKPPIGKKYGYWTVLSFVGIKDKTKYLIKAKCDCGKIKNLLFANLKYGRTKSCGCKFKELLLLTRRKGKTDFDVLSKSVFNSYKSKSKRIGLEFNISLEQFKKLIVKNCFYCGVKPLNIRKSKHKLRNCFYYTGIDRKNNKKGYIKYNCIPCCSVCNYAKKDHSYKMFIKYLDNLVKYRNKLKNSKNNKSMVK